jgi:dipeptidyl aminopeptidase/acylaminoacyl peptidase
MNPFTMDAYLKLKLPDDAQISPDGQVIAFALAENGKEAADKPPKCQIWCVPADGSAAARPLTSGPCRDQSPRWSPDGARLAFLSDREQPGKSLQICLLPLEGGEATPLTQAKGQISAIAWCRDGVHIAFLMSDPEPEGQGDVIHFEDRPLFQRLHVVNVATAEVRPVSPEGVQVWEFAESPDGAEFALVASPLPWEWSWYESYIGRVPAAGGASVAKVAEVPGRQVASPVWAPDSSQIAFLCSRLSDRGSVRAGLWVAPADGGAAPRHVTEGYAGSLTWLSWRDSAHILFTGYEGLEATIGQIRLDGRVELAYKGLAGFSPRFQPRFSSDRSGERLAVVREDLQTLADVWVMEPGSGAWRQASRVNPEAEALQRPQAEAIRWRSADGTQVEGILLTPPGYSGSQRLPLVVIVHGGPTAQYDARMATLWAPFLPLAGVAVLLPNPRGSTGRGLAFAEANLGDMGGGDLQDILAGVDALVERGVADPDRLGIGGWSYGGYMTAWATTQTDRFKAAVAGAAVIDWTSFHGTSEIPTWDALYLQDQPYGGEAYLRWSPIAHARRVKTPTLILHGGSDTCVPVGQAYQWHRALRDLGVETHLRVYPREPHGLKERAHVKDMQEAAVAWFVEHLKG